MTGAADHFSRVADAYASFRPRYPSALFAYLAGLTPRHELAWDCGAGSGQATLDLAAHFHRVIATDMSAEQIGAAPRHPSVEYRVAPAEAGGLPDASVDLIAVAQALHWFDLDRFYGEVRRVAAPHAVIAAWTYRLPRSGDRAIDAALGSFYRDVVGPYWPAERRHVDAGYRTLPFPFEELVPPPLDMESEWTLADLVGYVRTWSASARFLAATGEDPAAVLAERVAPVWGPPERMRKVEWPLALRVGRVHAR